MRHLTLFLCLLLLGCEKRVADPEVEAVKEWLLSEGAQNAAASSLLEESRITLDQLVPRDNWVTKRAVSPMKGEWFVLYAERKTGDGESSLIIKLGEGRYSFISGSWTAEESEM